MGGTATPRADITFAGWVPAEFMARAGVPGSFGVALPVAWQTDGSLAWGLDLWAQLKAEGLGIFLISHDIHDVFDLADRIAVMLQGKLVGTVDKDDVTKDDVLGMIIMGKQPGEVSQSDREHLHD
jgi:hypothetical protein